MKNSTHIRRCHVCGCVNEVKGSLVKQCSGCGRHLQPFYFFSEEKALELKLERKESIRLSRTPSALTSALPLAEYPMLIGLTAAWD